MIIVSQDRKHICNYGTGCSIDVGKIIEGYDHSYLPIKIYFHSPAAESILLGEYDTLADVKDVMNKIYGALVGVGLEGPKGEFNMPTKGDMNND